MLALLQRFREAEGGRILIDGKDIARVTQDSLREAISVVPQDVSLFHRSVLENIRYGRPEATDDEVYAAAEAAGCRDFIDALPEGFDTIVGDRGVKLSGGQRQRLAIARAFLQRRADPAARRGDLGARQRIGEAVQRALDRLMVGRTVIAVAHRLSTLHDFDRIVVMDGGRIIQDGSPTVLERSPDHTVSCCDVRPSTWSRAARPSPPRRPDRDSPPLPGEATPAPHRREASQLGQALSGSPASDRRPASPGQAMLLEGLAGQGAPHSRAAKPDYD